MSTKFLSPGWRMPRNANQNKQANYSLQRTGVNQYVQADNLSIDSGPSFTISCWVFGADIDTSGYHAFWGTEHYGTSTGGFVIYYGSGAVTFYSSLPGSGSYFSFTTANNLLVDNVWQQVTIRYNYGVDYRIYINNVLRAINTTNNSITWPEQNIRLFRHYSNDGYDHDGALSDWCFFNYALSDTATSVGDTATGQIAQLYGNGSSLSNPMALPNPPIAYYPLGESAGGFVGSSGTWLTENNAIGDYVFKIQPGNGIDTGVINLGYQFTVSFWFQRTVTGEYRLLNVTNSAGDANTRYLVDIVYPGSNQVFSHITDTSGYDDIVDSNIPLNSWIHCAYTRNGRDSNIYLSYNGAFNQNSGANSMQFPVSEATTNTYIANLIQSIPGDGFLSNVNYFTSVLTLSEIETLYNYGSPIRTLANIPQNSNLKAWYKLDSTEIYNSTSTEWSVDNNKYPSTYQSSLNFDTNKKINLNSDIGLSGAAASTFSIWVNFTTTTTGGLILNSGPTNNGGSDGLFLHSNVLKFRADGNAAEIGSFSSVISTGKWYHICGVFSGGNYLKIYLNGADATTNTPTVPNTMSTSITDFVIGWNSWYGYFDGEISNVAIYNTALSPSNIQTLYNNGVPQPTIYGSPIAHWKLDNTTSGIGNALSPYTTALRFDGANINSDYISVPSSLPPSGTSNFALSGWFYRDSNSSIASVYFDKVSGTNFLVREAGLSGTIEIFANGTNYNYSSLSTYNTANAWHHIVISYDGSNLTVYVDTNKLSQSATGLNILSTSDMRIGARAGDQSGSFFKGFISNVAVYNTNLTDSNVSTLYNNGEPQVTIFGSPQAWYKLDSTTITDSSGNGNTGTNNGATTVSSYVSTLGGINSGATEYAGFVNVLAGDSSGMSQSNLVQSDLQTVAPYSKYAMNFDAASNDFINCGNDSSLEITGNFTISTWINITSDGYYPRLIGKSNSGNTRCNYGIGFLNYKPSVIANDSGTWYADYNSTALSTGMWYNVVGIYDGSNFLLYVNGALDRTTSVSGFNIATAASETSGDNLLIAEAPSVSDNFDGKISNVSIWNTNLTLTQVREIYNQGLPKDLNSHSAYSNLISWWQLGENSSFATNWICADEKGTNNGESQNMGVDALTNGVGTTANGTSTGMAVGDLVGDAPYSTANAISSGMAVTAKGTDVP